MLYVSAFDGNNVTITDTKKNTSETCYFMDLSERPDKDSIKGYIDTYTIVPLKAVSKTKVAYLGEITYYPKAKTYAALSVVYGRFGLEKDARIARGIDETLLSAVVGKETVRDWNVHTPKHMVAQDSGYLILDELISTACTSRILFSDYVLLKGLTETVERLVYHGEKPDCPNNETLEEYNFEYLLNNGFANYKVRANGGVKGDVNVHCGKYRFHVATLFEELLKVLNVSVKKREQMGALDSRYSRYYFEKPTVSIADMPGKPFGQMDDTLRQILDETFAKYWGCSTTEHIDITEQHYLLPLYVSKTTDNEVYIKTLSVRDGVHQYTIPELVEMLETGITPEAENRQKRISNTTKDELPNNPYIRYEDGVLYLRLLAGETKIDMKAYHAFYQSEVCDDSENLLRELMVDASNEAKIRTDTKQYLANIAPDADGVIRFPPGIRGVHDNAIKLRTETTKVDAVRLEVDLAIPASAWAAKAIDLNDTKGARWGSKRVINLEIWFGQDVSADLALKILDSFESSAGANCSMNFMFDMNPQQISTYVIACMLTKNRGNAETGTLTYRKDGISLWGNHFYNALPMLTEASVVEILTHVYDYCKCFRQVSEDKGLRCVKSKFSWLNGVGLKVYGMDFQSPYYCIQKIDEVLDNLKQDYRYHYLNDNFDDIWSLTSWGNLHNTFVKLYKFYNASKHLLSDEISTKWQDTLTNLQDLFSQRLTSYVRSVYTQHHRSLPDDAIFKFEDIENPIL